MVCVKKVYVRGGPRAGFCKCLGSILVCSGSWGFIESARMSGETISHTYIATTYFATAVCLRLPLADMLRHTGVAGCRRVRVAEQPAGAAVEVSLKIAGIHWWYRTRSHAAELTAGYYNTANRDGYNSLIEICAEHGAALTLTCVEMCDAQHPPEALCGPEGLLRQVWPSHGNLLSCLVMSAVQVLRVAWMTPDAR